jgi:uncharacterized glyoxalase superfamily metalloenzyme YdcJ
LLRERGARVDGGLKVRRRREGAIERLSCERHGAGTARELRDVP